MMEISGGCLSGLGSRKADVFSWNLSLDYYVLTLSIRLN